MQNSKYLFFILFFTSTLPACNSKNEPEFIEVKTFSSVQSPYFLKEFALLKYDKTCFLKTTSVLEDGTEINKNWGVMGDNLFLVDDNTPKNTSMDTTPNSPADQQIEEYLQQMKINKEVTYIKSLLSIKSRNKCGIK